MKQLSSATINRLKRQGFRVGEKGQFYNKDNSITIYPYEDKPIFQLSITNIKYSLSEFFREIHLRKLLIIKLIEMLEQEYGNLRSK